MDNIQESASYALSAPGKVILFGEHSVVYKKAAVSTSIGSRLYVVVNSLKENEVSVKLPQIGTKINCTLDQFELVVREKCPLKDLVHKFSIDKPEDINQNEYIQSLINNLHMLGINTNQLQEKHKAALLGILYVVRGMLHNVKGNLLPFNLEVKSDLEIGAGSGSSAAFSVAIAGSILYMRKILETKNNHGSFLPITVIDNVMVNSHSLKCGFSLEELKIINKWAYCIEKIMHGHPSGLDNTICTFGSVVMTCQERKGSEELFFRQLENIPKISILLIYTGVSRNTSKLVATVRELRERNHLVVDAIMNAMDVIALEACKTLNALGENFSNFAKTMELYNVLGELMELNHGLLRTLGVSHESLEHIVRVCKDHGLASKLTGAGGGGYAITLVPPNFCKDKINDLKKELEQFKITEINMAEDGMKLEYSSGQW